MATANGEALKQAFGIMILATPFMFGVLALFSLIIVGLSHFKTPPKGAH
jgi:hypothetical protein